MTRQVSATERIGLDGGRQRGAVDVRHLEIQKDELIGIIQRLGLAQGLNHPRSRRKTVAAHMPTCDL